MSFFPEDRAAELRELFFESATELLQALNDEGLKLEKEPANQEILREVRRTVHTLKGDSAACGYEELSELAHQLEDALVPEVASRAGAGLAEIVLIAADTFSSMISAYREQMQPPDGQELLAQIASMAEKKARASSAKVQARFAWSEYEQMVAAEAVTHGESAYSIGFHIDPKCPMRAAAIQLVRNVLQECGRILTIYPDQSSPSQDVQLVEALIATNLDEETIRRKCLIPSVVSQLVLKMESGSDSEREQAPDIVEHVTRAAEEDAAPAIAAVEIAAEDTLPAGDALNSSPEQPAPSFSAHENVLRVDAERIDNVLNLVGELIIAKSMLHQAVGEFDKRFPKDPLRVRFADALAFQARIMNDLQKSVMKIRMVPVEQLFRRFPRVVRDVARSCGKEVTLAITGQDTDLDKSILDMLAEPLAHLVRNSVDHGIESPADRLEIGKPAEGTVKLAAYHQGNQIVIEVTDDGRGIDGNKLVAKAIERGVLTQAEAAGLSETEVLNLIFHPGLSTAEHVTSISGRGVGMDVVKTVLERLKGSINIRTVAGKGTTFSLKVPLTLAIIKALLFCVEDRMYAVPLSSVVEITRTASSEVHCVDGQEIIRLRDQVLALIRLNREQIERPAQKMFVVIVSHGERKFGLVVDKLVGEEELVIKALDDHLVATDLVSGASILGDGTVVLILNIATVVSKLGDMQRVGAPA